MSEAPNQTTAIAPSNLNMNQTAEQYFDQILVLSRRTHQFLVKGIFNKVLTQLYNQRTILLMQLTIGGKYKMYTGLTGAEPTTTVNTAAAGYAVATLVVNIDGGTF